MDSPLDTDQALIKPMQDDVNDYFEAQRNQQQQAAEQKAAHEMAASTAALSAVSSAVIQATHTSKNTAESWNALSQAERAVHAGTARDRDQADMEADVEGLRTEVNAAMHDKASPREEKMVADERPATVDVAEMRRNLRQALSRAQ